MKILLLSLVLIITIQSQGQNYIYKGSQQYPATSTWSFPTNGGGWPSTAELTIAKTKTGGYLMLTADVPIQEFSISGTISMILHNGKLITLTQKVVTDHVDGNSKVLYTISPLNYALLKEHDIEQIRFSILNGMMKTKESYTASNKKFSASIFESDKYSTAAEIAALTD